MTTTQELRRRFYIKLKARNAHRILTTSERVLTEVILDSVAEAIDEAVSNLKDPHAGYDGV